jgi:hypothetical protein
LRYGKERILMTTVRPLSCLDVRQFSHYYESEKGVNDRHSLYDRELLLLGPKRNAVLKLWEVERYGENSYGNPEYVSIYGMRPADWYANGVRLLGRTAVECTHDELGDAIGKDVAAVVSTRLVTTPALIVDAFAGSGNTLYWILRHMAGARGIGFESDTGVFNLTRQNIAALALPIEIVNADYRSGLGGVDVSPGELLVMFIAPPWGDALRKTSGLDLRRTSPPVTDIVGFLLHRFPHNQLLCVIQIYEIVLPDSVGELKARFDWSIERIYDLNTPGQNHGIVLGTKGWIPPR